MSQKTLQDFPVQATFWFEVPASAAAVDTVLSDVLAPWEGYVSAVQYIPNAAITGANTNNRTLSLVNVGPGATGGGVTATKTFNTGVNAPANAATNLTVATAPVDPNNAVINTNYVAATGATLTAACFLAGDVLNVSSVHGGTGLADPGGELIVTLQKFI